MGIKWHDADYVQNNGKKKSYVEYIWIKIIVVLILLYANRAPIYIHKYVATVRPLSFQHNPMQKEKIEQTKHLLRLSS